MIDVDAVRLVFQERGLDLNATQARMLALLAQELTPLTGPDDWPERRFLVLHCGARVGASTLWAAVAASSPDVLLCGESQTARHRLGFADLSRPSVEVANKLVIVDDGALSGIRAIDALRLIGARRPYALVLG